MHDDPTRYTRVDRLQIGASSEPLSALDVSRLMRVAEVAGLAVTPLTAEDSGLRLMTCADLVDFAMTEPASPRFYRDVRESDARLAFGRVSRLDRDLIRLGRSALVDALPRVIVAQTAEGETIVDVGSLATRLDATRDIPSAWVGLYPRHLRLLRAYVKERLATEVERADQID